MPTPVVFALGLLLPGLAAHPALAGGVGARQMPAAHTFWGASGVAASTVLPDTARRPALPDTTRRPALVPDTTAVPTEEVKPTRKTTLLTVLAIAVLTVSTLLLYNVRSR